MLNTGRLGGWCSRRGWSLCPRYLDTKSPPIPKEKRECFQSTDCYIPPWQGSMHEGTGHLTAPQRVWDRHLWKWWVARKCIFLDHTHLTWYFKMRLFTILKTVMCEYLVAFNLYLSVLSHAIQSTIVPILIYSLGGGGYMTFETPCTLANLIPFGIIHCLTYSGDNCSREENRVVKIPVAWTGWWTINRSKYAIWICFHNYCNKSFELLIINTWEVPCKYH